MAVVLDSLNATLTRTVFLKPPDMQRELTPIPRAIVNFNILNGVISAKPDSDQQELIIGVTLDGSFAYKMVDLSWSLIQDVADNWTPRAYIEVTNGIRNLELGATQRHPLLVEDMDRIPTLSEMWVIRVSPEMAMPRYVIQARTAAATPVITFKASNSSTSAAAAGTTNFFCSFFEFDIEQVERYPMHFALQVYPR